MTFTDLFFNVGIEGSNQGSDPGNTTRQHIKAHLVVTIPLSADYQEEATTFTLLDSNVQLNHHLWMQPPSWSHLVLFLVLFAPVAKTDANENS